jgi:serine phosphatase RsbU (regulator of sigma subunit)/Tfp pilus assembly protein PilF
MQKTPPIHLKFIGILLGILLLFCSKSILADQNPKIDSLLTLIKKDKPDTNKVIHLNELAWILKFQNPDTSLILGNQALKIIQSIKLPENGNTQKRILAKTHSQLGVFYDIKGEYAIALDYYLKAEKILKEIKAEKELGDLYNYIGILYRNEKDYNNALNYHKKSYAIAQELESKASMAKSLTNIGMTYLSLNKNVIGQEYLHKSLKLKEEIGDQAGITVTLTHLGNSYFNQSYYDKALVYYTKALESSKKENNVVETVNALGNIGGCYLEQKKYKLAYNYLSRALTISDSIGFKSNSIERYAGMSLLYKKSNTPLLDTIEKKTLDIEEMRLRSLYYLKRAEAIKNELFSEEKQREFIKKGKNNELEKEEEITKAKNQKELAISEEKNNTQKTISIAVAFALIALFLLSLFIFRSLKVTRKQKEIIEQKSKETEFQKQIIEEKNKDITASINYAKRIQSALLREEEHVSKHLPEHFILFLPKDIVSGDFYWGAEKNEYWYFTAADCTGHGVPGAIMSMLGISFLNDIVLSENTLTPAEILNQLRDRMITELRQTDANIGNKDGMDISLCRLNLKTLELEWAGANNALNLIRKGILEEIKADKQPIGYHTEMKPFTNHQLQLQKGDCVYIYSDGFADQFGGPQGKKFKYKKLEELIIKHYQLKATEQKQIFKNRFTEWKGSLDQVDDVCLFGVRV